jgi:hypothetical protein
VDGTGSGPCPVAGSGVSGDERSSLVTQTYFRHLKAFRSEGQRWKMFTWPGGGVR